MIEVVLGLGSNVSFNGMESQKILENAVLDLKKMLKNVEISSVYKTKPKYFSDQADFFNMALKGFVDDGFSAFELLEKCNEIEAKYGRDRTKEKRNGPRPLDIDIELFGNEKIETEVLTVPHPRLAERAFVLVPMMEIMPNDADVKKMCNRLSDDEKNSVVREVSENL